MPVPCLHTLDAPPFHACGRACVSLPLPRLHQVLPLFALPPVQGAVTLTEVCTCVCLCLLFPSQDDGSAAGRDLQLFGNTAETGGGGAIHVLRQGTVSLEGGLAVGNTAVADVGGSVALASNGGQLLLAAGLQLSNNSFTTPGAVLSVDTGSYMLANDIVVETSAGGCAADAQRFV